MAATEEHIGLELALAIRAGELRRIGELLDAHPGLAAKPIAVLRSRTPLMVVADWPGFFPNGPQIVRLLVAAGADPNATGNAKKAAAEGPLHWAASSDDVDVAEALIDAGADIEAQGSSIAGGAPLENAVGYGCWHVARLLVVRGAHVPHFWQAAALGLTERVEEFLAGSPAPTEAEINHAFWQACHGGQRRMAELLLARGADINWTPDYAEETPLQIAGSTDTCRGILSDWLRERGAT
jgi:ankyrin repeat protein